MGKALIEAVKAGGFTEPTPGRPKTLRHRMKPEEGWIDV